MTDVATKYWAARCQSQNQPPMRPRLSAQSLVNVETIPHCRAWRLAAGAGSVRLKRICRFPDAQGRPENSQPKYCGTVRVADAPDHRLVCCPCSRDNLDRSCEPKTEVEVCPTLVDGDFGEAV